jgi:hypothetical protein
LAKKSNSNIFEIYLATKKHHHTPLPDPPIAVFWPRKVIQIFLKYIWRQKNTTLTHSPAPCDFFAMKHNSNIFEIYLATKNIPYPAPPVADFFVMKSNSNNFEYIWRQKNTTLTHSPAPCDFFVMKSNSNNFEIYLATKKHYHTPLPPVADFFAKKSNSNNFEIYLATKNTTIPHSPLIPLLFFVMKSNSNIFEIYLATKKHLIPPAQFPIHRCVQH